MSGARSRRKGAVGERELSRLLTDEGFPATRGAQHRGGPGSPDVLCPSLPGIHFEAKRCERLDLLGAIEQARSEAGGRLPVVAHRRNGCEWVAILPLADLLAIVRESSYVEQPASEPRGRCDYCDGRGTDPHLSRAPCPRCS